MNNNDAKLYCSFFRINNFQVKDSTKGTRMHSMSDLMENYVVARKDLFNESFI